MLEHFIDHVGNITDDGHIHLYALGDARWIDVDMDDLAGNLAEMSGVADHPVIETRPDGQHDIGVLHRHVGFISPMHAQHAKKLLVGGGKTAQAH